MDKAAAGFSVVIPVYNGSAVIAKAINSCLQQTLQPLEIIVIDDASEDSTASIVQNIGSSLVVYHRNTSNLGPSASRNIGIAMAGGDWICFLDADDIFHPAKLEVISYFIERNSDIYAIGHGFRHGADREWALGSEWRSASITKRSKAQVLVSNPVVTPALAVSKKNEILFNSHMHYAEDFDFILRTTESFGLWYVDLPLTSLLRMPLTPGGISANRWKMRKGEIDTYISYCKRNHKTFLMPFLVAFSLLKHVKNAMFLSRHRN